MTPVPYTEAVTIDGATLAAAVAAAWLAVGSVMLIAGGRLLRPAMIIAGAAIGAVLGGQLLARLDPDLPFNASPAMVGASTGVAAGAALLAVLYRLVLAGGSAALLGTVALGVAIYAGVGHHPGDTPPPDTNAAQTTPTSDTTAEPPSADRARREAAAVSADLARLLGLGQDAVGPLGIEPRRRSADAPNPDASPNDPAAGTTKPAAVAQAEAAVQAAGVLASIRQRVADLWTNAWGAISPGQRVIALAALAGGTLLGLMLGGLAPHRAAVLLTAGAGSAIVLVAGHRVVAVAAPESLSVLDMSADGWLAVWAILGILGLSFQVLSTAKRPAPADDDAD